MNNTYILKKTVYFISGLILIIFLLKLFSIPFNKQIDAFLVIYVFYIIGIIVFTSIRQMKFLILILILILPWQNFISMILIDDLTPLGLKVLTSIKELIILTVFLKIFLKNYNKIKLDTVDYIGILLIIIYSLNLLRSGISFVSLVSYREIFIIVILYFLGRLLIYTTKEIEQYLKLIVIISISVMIFSFIEYFTFDNETWDFLGANKFSFLKYSTAFFHYHLYEGLPKHWFTYIGSEQFRRMVGPIGDATSLSRYMAFPFLIILYSHRKKVFLSKNFLLLLLFLIVILLTLGRGGQIIIFIGISLFIIYRYPTIGILLTIGISFILLLKTSLLNIESPNAIRHMDGLIKGTLVALEHPLGKGLGTAGSMAVLYSANIEERVEESLIGSIGYQTGLLGIIFYNLFMLSILYKHYKFIKYFKKKDDVYLLILSISTILGVYITSFFADSAIAPISSALIFIYAGMISTYLNKTLILRKNEK